MLASSNHQVYDLMNLVDLFEEPSAKHKYLFNGDFVDRGQWGVETLMILLSKTLHSYARIFYYAGTLVKYEHLCF